eukprot:gene1303-1423_t
MLAGKAFSLRSALRSSPWTIAARLSSTHPEIIAELRSTGMAGSRRSRAMREEGRIPGVLYGVDDDRNVLKRMVTIDKKKLLKELNQKGSSFENTLYNLVLESEAGSSSHLVVPRQAQFCPLTGNPLAVNFLRYYPGTTRLRIPIDFVNEDQSADVKRGSFVINVNTFVDCFCEGEVPRSLVLDLSNAKRGDIFRLSSLTLPPGVRPTRNMPLDLVLAVVKSFRG